MSNSIDETVRFVSALLQDGRRLTVTNLQTKMAKQLSHNASRGTIHTALTQYLQMTKVCARWVPRELSENDRKLRMGWALEFLAQYHEQGKERVVTGDES